MRHRHVQEYNARKAAKVTSRRHSQWTNEEEDVLLDTANDIWSETPNLPKCQLYNRLSERLTGRSREAIKRRLLGLHWTPLASINGNTESNPQQRVDSERTVLWRAGLLEAVVRSCDRKHVLYKLAQALLRSRIGIDQGRSRLSTYVEKSYPYSKKAHRRPTTRADLDGLGEREINQINRTKLQKLLRRNKRCGAQQVLNGTWRNAYKGKPDLPVGFQTFWSNILSSGSVADDRPANELRPVDWTLIRPVTVEEVQRSLKRMGRTAPGPDGITPQQLYKRRHSTITALMNLILALEAVPEHLNLARIVFIPKCEDPQTPEDYRPISITSVTLRCLHSILCQRWSDHLSSLNSQLAFLRRDGCFDGVTSVNMILRDTRMARRKLTMCAVDVSKAFDSVSHATITRVASMYGAPAPLISYLTYYYDSSYTDLLGTRVKVGRGVRQGDPLSPLLFIMCMDEVIQYTDRNHGALIGGGRIDSLLFADDMMIFTETAVGMQRKLNQLSAALEKSGLTINAQKSRSLTLIPNGKDKTLCVVPKVYSIAGEPIAPITVVDEFPYLGIRFNHQGIAQQPLLQLTRKMLTEVQAAPLTPIQQLHILRCFVLPKLQYIGQVGFVSVSALSKADILIRKMVKQSVNLPNDTATSYFHARIRDGGLGVESLSSTIPLRRAKRLRSFSTRNCGILELIRQSAGYQTLMARCKLTSKVMGIEVSNIDSMQSAWKSLLYNTLDGKGLRSSDQSPASHLWVTSSVSMFPWLYKKAIQLRGHTLNTKTRRARGGRTHRDLKCSGGCNKLESLTHILQECACTQRLRISRHNRVVTKLEGCLQRLGFAVRREPRIANGQSYLKPDLIACKFPLIYILDVIICADERSNTSWNAKLRKYNRPTLNKCYRNVFDLSGVPEAKVRHLPVVVTMRGMLYSKTETGLRQLGLPKSTISWLSEQTIIGSLICYDAYMAL
ncbi:Retrovirus-related Pol polyprotein from type-2 retrotransposable element R2DM [Schistosoma japonicum]|nr:Retrovirus-related Pol polyprotein from type-2 retrotransposable element R2DM [Schistosoma japonicum]